MVRKVLACTLALLLLSGSPWLRAAPEKNGFDLTGALVPVDEIHPGGPPRDGIPSIDEPRFVSAREADFLKPRDRVLGVVRGGVAKAYPFSELSQTDGVVTDALNGQSITVRFDGEHQRATVEDANGMLLPGVTGFWFAWYAFHPETEVFRADR